MPKRDARGRFVQTRFKLKSPKQIRKEMDPGFFKSLGQAGAYIRAVARRMIRKSPQPAPAGHAPHTRRGQLKNAILFAVEKPRMRVLIGPTFRGVGRSMMAHEFGGRYRGENFPRRPLMEPALERSRSRLPRFWSASIK
jgi:hypothetical protein